MSEQEFDPAMRAILEQGKWFHALPQDLKNFLISEASVKNYRSGQYLFARGDSRSGLYAVISGAVRITGLNENGKEAILTFIEPSNWMGEVALFDGDDRTHDAIAEGDVCVLEVSQASLDSLLKDQPHYWREFGLLIAHKLRLAFRAIEDLSLLPAPVRLARRLILMAEGYGELEGEARKVIAVPQEQLGAMLSISRQTTNQILKELSDKGLVKVAYGEIEILDMDGLRANSGLD